MSCRPWNEMGFAIANTEHHGVVVAGVAFLQVSDVMPSALARKRPLILLNDKRYRHGGQLKIDKRMILDIDGLAVDIATAYPQTDVVVARFRDMPMVEQLQIMSVAQVFITTAGSSSHLAVFMPRGSHVIYLGGPETEQEKQNPWGAYTSFNELDRWFPITYVQFQRYVTDIKHNMSYTLDLPPDAWQPGDPPLRERWQRYNANLRVDMGRLRPMLDKALGS